MIHDVVNGFCDNNGQCVMDFSAVNSFSVVDRSCK